MPVQEIEGALAVDGMRAYEPLELAAIANPQSRRVGKPNLREFVSYGLIRSYAVEMSPLDHERTRRDQARTEISERFVRFDVFSMLPGITTLDGTKWAGINRGHIIEG